MNETTQGVRLRHGARLEWITPNAEGKIAYCARVSNPANQENPDYAKLLRYCADKQHWSIFEMASACFEIKTSRAIARQILRHRSFSFQEFSTRYAKVENFQQVEARRQDARNRQGSIDDLDAETVQWWAETQQNLIDSLRVIYDMALERGIAKECARAILPEGLTESTMYMTGTIRSWITYVNLRTGHGTQLEHQRIAREIQELLIVEMPIIGEAFGWSGPEVAV